MHMPKRIAGRSVLAVLLMGAALVAVVCIVFILQDKASTCNNGRAPTPLVVLVVLAWTGEHANAAAAYLRPPGRRGGGHADAALRHGENHD
jgi:hypothetical protein